MQSDLVKHRLNSFLSSKEYFLVLFMKIDKVVTIYSKLRFDYHKGNEPGMVNAHLHLKMSLFSNPLWYFQSVNVILLHYQKQVLCENFRLISLNE